MFTYRNPRRDSGEAKHCRGFLREYTTNGELGLWPRFMKKFPRQVFPIPFILSSPVWFFLYAFSLLPRHGRESSSNCRGKLIGSQT
jgi:hypothetical protein